MVEFLNSILGGNNFRLNKKKRLLHERSHLALEFPQSNQRAIRTFIPFLENPQISERGKIRLNNYDLIGRAGQLFSYGGAESRRISLTFNISLLHVIETNISEGITDKFKRQFRVFFTESEQAKYAFQMKKMAEAFAGVALPEQAFGFGVSQGTAADLKIQDPKGNGRDHASIHREYYRKIIGDITGEQLEQEESESFLAPILSEAGIATLSQGYKELDDVIDLVYCWVNLIRASILNNSRSSLYGPPIVRLTHGPMYNNIPCLVEDYSIQIVDEIGYEVQTLTPKRLQIQLNLIESRTGNFNKYEATQLETGDNVTGWESIIENNDIDPYNGLIGSSRGG